MKILESNTLLQNRYLIDHLIGKGGMGEVYLAVDQRLGHKLALKRTFFTDDETLAYAFEREARTLASLRHPVLPKVSDHFTEDGVQYLVMEFISGEDLYKRIEITKKPFPMNWVLFWADELLEALSYLHARNPPIIHRDIKPQNLKLTNDNHIILLDFGLAKNNAGPASVDSTGSIVGYTPHYAPMEQIRGLGTTPQSDIYSLSATLYQLMTCVIPPDALSRADDVLNGRPDTIKPLSELNPDISTQISDVILKGIALRPADRYANAREMQKALREAFAEVKEKKPKSNGNESIMPATLQSQMQTEQFVFQNIPSTGSNVTVADIKIDPNILVEPLYSGDANIVVEDYQTTTNIPSEFSVPAGEVTEVMTLKDDKTEVMEPIGEKTAVMSGFDLPQTNAEDDIPMVTVPLISFGKEVNLDYSNNTDVGQMQPSAFVEQDVVFDEQNASPSIAQKQPMVKKKSSGLAFAILGIIGLLGVMLVGGAAGLYYYSDYGNNNATVLPSPTVTPTPESPSPEPTLEVLTEPSPEPTQDVIYSGGNSNLSSNTNSSDKITPSNTPVIDVKPTQIQTPKPVVDDNKPIVTQTPVKVTTPKPTPVARPTITKAPTPTPKPTPAPKPTPKKGGATDILQ
jgi:serine/threonine protein kinase